MEFALQRMNTCSEKGDKAERVEISIKFYWPTLLADIIIPFNSQSYKVGFVFCFVKTRLRELNKLTACYYSWKCASWSSKANLFYYEPFYSDTLRKCEHAVLLELTPISSTTMRTFSLLALLFLFMIRNTLC